MKVKAALCFGGGEPWKVVDVDVDEPRQDEVQVKMAYAGLCHSDEHARLDTMTMSPEAMEITGALSFYPTIGGHEGSGVVEAVGPGVTTLKPGDHVAACFIPSCGRCRWCGSGLFHLCDRGVSTMGGPMISDRTFRYHFEGEPINRVAQLGTFSDRMVCHESSLVKVDPDIPLRVAAVVSCGIATGYGSSVDRAGVRPGETVVVVGCGGVGSGALLGAKAAGAGRIIAVDPVEFKRESAMELGATHVAESVEEAFGLVRDLTWGEMADAVVLTPGQLMGDLIAPAVALAGKNGRIVCTAIAPQTQVDVKLSLVELAMYNKSLLGTLYGSANPRTRIPQLLAMYARNQLDVDAVITNEYPLADINRGYDDMHNGLNLRGVLALN